MAKLLLAHFYLSVIFKKTIIWLVFSLLMFIFSPYLVIRKQISPWAFFMMPRPSEWERVFQQHIHFSKCRWFVVSPQKPQQAFGEPMDLPPYCYWREKTDKRTGMVACLYLEDAAYINIKYGGNIVSEKNRPD